MYSEVLHLFILLYILLVVVPILALHVLLNLVLLPRLVLQVLVLLHFVFYVEPDVVFPVALWSQTCSTSSS